MIGHKGVATRENLGTGINFVRKTPNPRYKLSTVITAWETALPHPTAGGQVCSLWMWRLCVPLYVSGVLTIYKASEDSHHQVKKGKQEVLSWWSSACEKLTPEHRDFQAALNKYFHWGGTFSLSFEEKMYAEFQFFIQVFHVWYWGILV